MEQSGEYRILAPRDRVWAALNDADVLRACIDGCESMIKVADDEFEAEVKARIGPVSATFKGTVSLVNLKPPESYGLNLDVKGGAVGFGKGTASVTLSEIEDGTQLAYEVRANVGGKIAQVGSRLIDGVTRKMVDHFFDAFSDQLGGEVVAAPGAERKFEQTGRWVIWAIVFSLLLLAALVAI